MYKLISGNIADSGEFDDYGQAEVVILAGPHAGHTAAVGTAKHNCGAYILQAVCSCGARYGNRASGCWQYGHQQEEYGDPELGKALGWYSSAGAESQAGWSVLRDKIALRVEQLMNRVFGKDTEELLRLARALRERLEEERT